MIFNRDNIIEILRTNVATVTFTKMNGEVRKMKCTLLSEHIPNASMVGGQVLTEDGNKKATTISVWDLEKTAWRSFRVDSVKSVSVG